MKSSYYRETWADIDLDAAGYNVARMRALIPEETMLMAVVKANAYGHGAVRIAETALKNGASWLAVAIFDEALALRKAGIKAPILVLSPIRPEDAEIAARYKISLTVFQKEWVEKAEEALPASLSDPVLIHIACDTGMGRIGIRNKEEAAAFAEVIQADRKFTAEGLFTHFSTADQDDETYFNEQYNRFETMIDWFLELGVRPKVIHCGNSAATLKYPAEQRHLFNMVRYGISMYGLSPSPEMIKKLPFPLKRVLSLHSRLMHVKKVEKGTSIGYGASYQSPSAEWIGTVPIGYADGWLRALSGSDLLVAGHRCPIVGRICMDQLMCRLPHEFPVGTEVTLIGREGSEEITADEIAKKLGTINYEVTCMIQPRVPRIFHEGGKKTDVLNPVLGLLD
ncbi:alanine racemase [Sporolactobacillus sp. THM19-2]|jgi:alanine racemase|uniref:alanine racemase n=1 Tax=Sporolactobacillus sp. THM19-2 TaxID=2511171 RepID=UPI00101EA014|nr:alanine racemase [Sporolactobacillus sp. THM19-2]RYL87573.1 alanine racemase [Sporolactobacillus sp. THM19-2]